MILIAGAAARNGRLRNAGLEALEASFSPFPPMDVGKLLAGNMKRLRKEPGWSQEALADEAGRDRTYIGGIERV